MRQDFFFYFYSTKSVLVFDYYDANLMTQTWNYFSIILFQKWYLIKSDIWLGKSFSNIHRRALRVTKVSSPFLQLKILRGFLPLLHQVSRNSYMKLITWRGIEWKFLLLKIQLWNSDYKRLLNKPYVNEVTLIRQNPPLKCYQLLEL